MEITDIFVTVTHSNIQLIEQSTDLVAIYSKLHRVFQDLLEALYCFHSD